MTPELENLYNEWLEIFHYQRDVRLQHHALLHALVDKKIIDTETYHKHWQILMETDLQQVGNNLKRKTKHKKNKTGFHFGVFSFFKRLKFW